MLFVTPQFFLFFALYLGCHYLVPARYRVSLIVVGSTVFYGSQHGDTVWLPFVLAWFAHAGTGAIARAGSERARRSLLVLTILAALGPLIIYRYGDFLYANVVGPFSSASPPAVSLPLPLGISFITLTILSYVVDVYRGAAPRETSFIRLVAYVLFFPLLIAGPILRPSDLLPQLRATGGARAGRITFGAGIFTLGVIKRVVVSDTLRTMVDDIYAAPSTELALAECLLGLYGFAVQLYCDISGTVDMAMGLAWILGIELPTSFRRPYLATSLVEFWRRWHITLSSWLRDYVYISLGGNRRGLGLGLRNVVITMLLGGLWYGADWTMVAWAAMHATCIAGAHMWRSVRGPGAPAWLPRWAQVAVTFHIVCVLFVFFRAPDFTTATGFLRGLFGGGAAVAPELAGVYTFPIVLLAVFCATHWLDEHARVERLVHRVPRGIVWSVMIALWILAAGMSGGNSGAFIYFDF